MKRNKFNVAPKWERTDRDGELYDSKGEMEWFQGLKYRVLKREIRDLKRAVRFDLIVNGILICWYEADATWYEGDRYVVADYKGHQTRLFIVKKKLMKACHGIDIIVVKAK